MTEEPKLTLFSDGLLSKWGFNDGDMPDEVWDYFEEMGVSMGLVNWHSILLQLVKSHLVPALDQDIELVEIETNHNPIRAQTINGENVEDLWYSSVQANCDPTTGEAPWLTPEWVEIDMAVVYSLI